MTSQVTNNVAVNLLEKQQVKRQQAQQIQDG
jgi:hypothetical protein